MADRIQYRPAPPRSLRVPHRVKLGVVVAASSAIVAGVTGAAQLPELIGDGEGSPLAPRSAGAAGTPPDRVAGTAASVTAGPAFPVDGNYDFGEAEAKFGASRGGRPHEGQDVFAKAGTPLVAVRSGIVVDEARAESALSGGRGNFVALYSELDHRTYVYFHMRERSPLREGEPVRAGDPVGAVGCTGSCWGNHLHFEIREGSGSEGRAIDPLPLLRDWGPRRVPGAGPRGT